MEGAWGRDEKKKKVHELDRERHIGRGEREEGEEARRRGLGREVLYRIFSSKR